MTIDRLNAALEGRYRVEGEVGEGGMATVYLAEDLRHGRRVAVKVLAPEVAAAVGSERFLMEIRTTARLQHPNILPLHDSGDADGLLYYVMPYVEGESLRQRIEEEGPLPISEAVAIAVELCDALRTAHGQDVVHRDIKPANILMSRGRPVLADFGIAFAVSAAGDDRLTRSGAYPGTPRYMSPEQASGEKVDGRTDVYALGCVLYEMLTGEPPFTGSSAAAVLARKMTEPVRSIRTVRSGVPEALEGVVLRALARSPADRYTTPEDFGRALQRAMTGPDGVRPTSRLSRPLSLALLLTLVALGTWTMTRPEGGGPPGAHPRTAVAVLPFENLSSEGPHAYFAGGLHGELLRQLQSVEAITVIGDRSVTDYAAAGRPLSEIADELGVGSRVEGSVQVLGDRLRVNVQLFDALADTLLWAERYDETLDDAFAVQSRMAHKIVQELGGEITGAEASAITSAPTMSAEAYRFYLQGVEYMDRPGVFRQNLEIAQRHFEEAVRLDSLFALAHARLAEVHGRFVIHRLDASRDRAEALRRAAETALGLRPELPQAHYAMGIWHLQGRRDYRPALEEFELALAGLPDNPWIWGGKAAAHRRLGEFSEALFAYERGVELDPRDADLIYDLGGVTYWITHRYEEAVGAFDRALALAPDHHAAAVDRAWIFFLRGEADELRLVLDGLPPDQELGHHLGTTRGELARLLLFERRTDSLLSLVSDSGPEIMANQVEFLPGSLYAAWALRLQGDQAASRASFESALATLDSALVGRPEDWRIPPARGLALAGLGQHAAALTEAEAITRSRVFVEDGFIRPIMREYRARIYAQSGAVEAALEDLRLLLAGPSFYVTPRTVRRSPLWDPLRDEPGFEALLADFPVD